MLSATRKRLRRAAIACCVLVLPLAGLGYAGAIQLTNNFHPVVEGEVYRSAQPSAADLADYAGRFGVRSVVNLRGANPGRDWYDQEVAEARRLGLVHIDFAISASRFVGVDQASRLVALMRDAPKPILIHCQAGADRTGLAAALYLAGIDGVSEATAGEQLSFRYGHVSLPISGSYAMDLSFQAYEAATQRGNWPPAHDAPAPPL